MTRETKIGLLVGLAFIIVIGILLSDHMTSTTQPQQALLSETAPNVRQSVTSPAPTGAAPAQIGQVPAISPTTPILTQAELNRPVAPVITAPPVSQVVIGGPARQPTQTITIQQTTPAVEQVQQPAAPAVAANQPATSGADEATAALQDWAQKNGESIVAVNETTKAPTAATAKKAEYIAVAGDSLSKMASKLLGSDTKANREAIVKANSSLQKNPNVVVIGRKYTIPMAAVAAKPAAEVSTELVPVTPGTKSIPITQLVDALPATPAKNDGTSWYTVKENDNLWKIASAELGSGNAWTQLKELNKDILKGSDTVQPKMRIRLPAKSVANAI
jgi:nucleoid-associated protein YgaU